MDLQITRRFKRAWNGVCLRPCVAGVTVHGGIDLVGSGGNAVLDGVHIEGLPTRAVTGGAFDAKKYSLIRNSDLPPGIRLPIGKTKVLSTIETGV